jgi:hypothetical protein
LIIDCPVPTLYPLPDENENYWGYLMIIKKQSLFATFILLIIFGILSISAVSAITNTNYLPGSGNSDISTTSRFIAVPGQGFNQIKLPNFTPAIKPVQSYPSNTLLPNQTPVISPKSENNNFSAKTVTSYSIITPLFTRKVNTAVVIPLPPKPSPPLTNWALFVDFDGGVTEVQANEIISSYNIPAGANIGGGIFGEQYYVIVSNNDYNSVITKIQSEKNVSIDLTEQRTADNKIIIVDFGIDYPGYGALQRLIAEGVPLKKINGMFIYYSKDTPDTVAKLIQSQLNGDDRVLYTKIFYGWSVCGTYGCGFV